MDLSHDIIYNEKFFFFFVSCFFRLFTISIRSRDSESRSNFARGTRSAIVEIEEWGMVEWENKNGERGNGDGESLKRGIFKSRNL